MGFYQDYDDRRQVVFQFDRIFSNRKSMDTLAETGQDGVFSGRFVLVKYDPQGKFFEGDVKVGYYYNNIMYQDAGYTQPYTYTTFERVVNPVAANWSQYYYYNGSYYFKLPNQNYFNAEETNYFIATNESESAVAKNQIVRLFEENFGLTQSYYKCSGSIDNASGSIATWSAINYDNSDSTYLKNYNIDKATYGTRFDVRGYDATIWEKVYSKGRGSFILIAYLNGVMPALDLFADPPTQTPAIPYIDALSSDSYYRIHVPSMYGFQLKEHDEDSDLKSDQKAFATKLIYNANTNSYDKREQEIDAAIYLNLDGANANIRNVDESTTNAILIEPNGESGRVYTNTDGTKETKDLMELSIQLPAIGNMMAKGYDLIYGEVINKTKRFTDINWVSGTASKIEKHNVNTKSYDLKSLAGCLNTMHDILGQIIVPLQTRPSPEQVEEQCSDDLIYQIGDSYYRKGIAYNPTIITDETKVYDPVDKVQKNIIAYRPQSITKDEFKGNTYYVLKNGSYVEATGYIEGETYYLKSITGARYSPIELEQFISGKYYWQDGQNYMCDNSANFPEYLDRSYYTISVVPGYPTQFLQEFIPNVYYTKEDKGYIRAAEALPQIGTIYYQIFLSRISTYYGRFYAPGIYYEYNADSRKYEICNDDKINTTKTYYIIVYSSQLSQLYDSEGHPYWGYAAQSITPLNADPTKEGVPLDIQGMPDNIDYYYYKDGNDYISYSFYLNAELTPGKAHPFTEARYWSVFRDNTTSNGISDSEFYISNRYWIKEEDTNHYIKGTAFNSANYYYLIEPQLVTKPFYLLDKYYYKIAGTEDEYEISKTSSMESDRYYTKEKIYVYNDNLNQCPHGYEWNDYVKYIPPSITLYWKTEYVDLIPMEGLINGEDSIYGKALAMHKLFGLNDGETRNTYELRGAFNVLQDLLYTIKTLRPGRLLYVNNFGQIESTDETITIDTIKELM